VGLYGVIVFESQNDALNVTNFLFDTLAMQATVPSDVPVFPSWISVLLFALLPAAALVVLAYRSSS
jgi:hypothetical protein